MITLRSDQGIVQPIEIATGTAYSTTVILQGAGSITGASLYAVNRSAGLDIKTAEVMPVVSASARTVTLSFSVEDSITPGRVDVWIIATNADGSTAQYPGKGFLPFKFQGETQTYTLSALQAKSDNAATSAKNAATSATAAAASQAVAEQLLASATLPSNVVAYDDEAAFLAGADVGDYGLYDGVVWKKTGASTTTAVSSPLFRASTTADSVNFDAATGARLHFSEGGMYYADPTTSSASANGSTILASKDSKVWRQVDVGYTAGDVAVDNTMRTAAIIPTTSGDTTTDHTADLADVFRDLVPGADSVKYGATTLSGRGVSRVFLPPGWMNASQTITLVNPHSSVLIGAGGRFGCVIRNIGTKTATLVKFNDGTKQPFDFTVRDVTFDGNAGTGSGSGPSGGVVRVDLHNISAFENVRFFNSGDGVALYLDPYSYAGFLQEFWLRRCTFQKSSGAEEGVAIKAFLTGGLGLIDCNLEVFKTALELVGNGLRCTVNIEGGHIERVERAFDLTDLTLICDGMTRWAGDLFFNEGVINSRVVVTAPSATVTSGGISDIGFGNAIRCTGRLNESGTGFGSLYDVDEGSISQGAWRYKDGVTYEAKSAHTSSAGTQPPNATYWKRVMGRNRGSYAPMLETDGLHLLRSVNYVSDSIFARRETLSAWTVNDCYTAYKNLGAPSTNGNCLMVQGLGKTWEGGVTYTSGDIVFDPTDDQYYEVTGTPTVNTMPSDDLANWTALSVYVGDDLTATAYTAYAEHTVWVDSPQPHMVMVGVWLDPKNIESTKITIEKGDGASTWTTEMDTDWAYTAGGSASADFNLETGDLFRLKDWTVFRMIRCRVYNHNSSNRAIRIRVHCRRAGAVVLCPLVIVSRSRINPPQIVDTGVTGTGTIGTSTITTSASLTGTLSANDYFTIGGETHIIQAITSGTITTRGTLAATHTAAAIYDLQENNLDDNGHPPIASYPTHPVQVTGAQYDTVITKKCYYDVGTEVSAFALLSGVDRNARISVFLADIESDTETGRVSFESSTDEEFRTALLLKNGRQWYGLLTQGYPNQGKVRLYDLANQTPGSPTTITLRHMALLDCYHVVPESNPVRLGTLSATGTYLIYTPHTWGRLLGVSLAVETTVSTDGTNYWDVSVQRKSGSGSAATVYTSTTNKTADLTLNTPHAFTLGQRGIVFADDEILQVVFTKNGSAANLVGATLTLYMELLT